MKVLIVGAGMQGQVLTWNLGRNQAVDRDRRGRLRRGAGPVRRRPGRAPARRRRSGSTRPTRDAVAAAAAGAKLVVNAVVPPFNMSIMRACLQAGADYLDMASGQTPTQTIDEAWLEQSALDPEFRRPA